MPPSRSRISSKIKCEQAAVSPSPTADLVTTDWLAQRLDAPDIRIVEASWHLPDAGRDAKRDYAEAHIPGAVFFDIDDIADTGCGLPHMLPSAEKFASRMRRLGLGDGHRIIVYDRSDVHSAARAWWMFRTFGYRDVAILDGGLQKWLAEGRPLDDMPPMPRERHFTARLDNLRVRDKEQMLRNVASGQEQVLDARSHGRFTGRVPEPRAGLKSGHIPGARNLPFTLLFNDDGTYKSADALAALFQAHGVDFARPVVTTCGSGISACALAFGLHLAGHPQVAVYDGSWAEWGADPDTPVATDDAA
ncbi:MAG: 3-mercaptopyruvate sulfurtransferase [Alphaproteobacteria bacterium]|nr:MAG: 3-mercaptopyruvate sulfurtransferase [Alphaproteobacteria bacterium]